MKTAWITCENCEEIEGSIVLCDEHRTPAPTLNDTLAALTETLARLNKYVTS